MKTIQVWGNNEDLGFVNLSDLRDADLSYADLTGADLSCTNLRGAHLSCTNLRGANLTGANLRGANLRDADLRNADLTGANLRDADLRDTNLSCTNLRDATIDFSCWPLHCGSLRAKIDNRLEAQLLYHVISVSNHKDTFTKAQIDFANTFHRVQSGECPKLERGF